MSEETFSHETYLSPFTWRYGGEDMRRVWSKAHRRRLWRRVWVALAAAQHEAGLVTAEQLADLRAHEEEIDLARAAEIEAEIRHDLMAEVKTYAEQCPLGGGIIHLGATSMDVKDNVEVLRQQEALDLLLEGLRALLATLVDLIEERADQPCMGFTHLQPAEPTTVGYRLAQYAQDLLADFEALRRLRNGLRGKGIKGAVGTSASYTDLLAGTGMTAAEMEARVMNALGLKAFPVATQTYPRRQDWEVLTALAGLAGSLYRLAFDLRLLQSPPLGEWREPFGEKQVGSSAMPFKRNPISAEKIDSLARYVAALPRVAWDNAAHSLLERTMDDSANRRAVLPSAFLAVDELLRVANRLLSDLRIDDAAVARNLATYGTFAATERLLMALVRAGADRQVMHEVIREHAMVAWEALQAGKPNPLVQGLCEDARIRRYLTPDGVEQCLDAQTYVGDAPQRARALAAMVRDVIA
ncbi:MAG: adenylosuccinate lyase [Anaerolineae bacterium]